MKSALPSKRVLAVLIWKPSPRWKPFLPWHKNSTNACQWLCASTLKWVLAGTKKFPPAMKKTNSVSIGIISNALELVGITCHIGSQITEVAPFVEAALRVEEMVGRLRSAGHDIRQVSL